MIVADIMTANVISTSSNMYLIEARKIMDVHRIRRLPVIDGGKLVGVVSRDALHRSGPRRMTTVSARELDDLLSKITVKEVMQSDVITVSPDTTVEEAVTLAQSERVGMLIVIDRDKVVGVTTTNDFFYKILNPLLGINIPGKRIVVRNCHEGHDIERVIATINRLSVTIVNLFLVDLPEVGKHDLVLHLGTECGSDCIEEIKKLGFMAEERSR